MQDDDMLTAPDTAADGEDVPIEDLLEADGHRDPCSSGRFKLSNKRLHLTYSYHLDVMNYHDWLSRKMAEERGVKIAVYSYVHETGMKKGKPFKHTHAALEFSKSVEITDSRFFDFVDELNPPEKSEWKHPMIVPVSKKPHWKHICEKYHAKEGAPRLTNYRDPSKTGLTIDELGDCNGELLTMMETMEDKGVPLNQTGAYIVAMDAVREGQLARVDLDEGLVAFDQLKDFQKELVRFCVNQAWGDNRMIMWILDPPGGAGKTYVQKVIEKFFQGMIITTPNIRDATYSVVQYQKEHGRYPKIIMMNLTKSTRTDIKSFYTLAEQFRDGKFTSEKYKSRSVTMDEPPLVVVFANEAPDLGTDGSKNLAIDRWSIQLISEFGDKFSHRFLGQYAKLYHDRCVEVEQETVEEALQQGEVYTPVPYDGQVLSIDVFPYVVKHEIIARMKELFRVRMIGSISLEVVPVSNAREYLEDLRTELRKRLPTPVEVSAGSATVLRLATRHMTPDEVRRQEEIEARGRGVLVHDSSDFEQRKKKCIAAFLSMSKCSSPSTPSTSAVAL